MSEADGSPLIAFMGDWLFMKKINTNSIISNVLIVLAECLLLIYPLV